MAPESVPRRPGFVPPQQQTCKVCGAPDKFNFAVPDDIWAAVVPQSFRNRVVCLYCFDEFAADRGIDYACCLVELQFAGRKAAFLFRTSAAASV